MRARCRQFAVCAVAMALPAQEAADAAIGTGPLLCCQAPADGASELWVAALDGEGPARVRWRGPGPVGVLARLDARNVLLAEAGDVDTLAVLDLTTGERRLLATNVRHGFTPILGQGTGDPALVAVHGDDVLYLGATPPAFVPALPDDYLYAVSWREPGERRRLCDRRLARVPVFAGNLAIAIAEGGREVWAISLLRGQGRRLWTLPDTDDDVRLALAPGGTRLAIGTRDANWRGRLVVVDTATGAETARWEDLPIDLSRLSSFTPTLEVAWRDDLHVVCSETRADRQGLRGAFVQVVRDVASGDVVDEIPYAELGLYHRLPGAELVGPHFEVEYDRATAMLRRAGADAVLARVERTDWDDLVLSPDRRFAVVHQRDETGGRTVLFAVDAADDAPRVLVPKLARYCAWLPAVPEPPRPNER